MDSTMMTDKNISFKIRSETIKDFENRFPEEHTRRLSELSKGLAHPARVEIVRMLTNKPSDKRCVCGDIVNELPLAQSSVSQHLKVLKETGWIEGKIDGPYVCYCIVEGIIEHYVMLIKRYLEEE